MNDLVSVKSALKEGRQGRRPSQLLLFSGMRLARSDLLYWFRTFVLPMNIGSFRTSVRTLKGKIAYGRTNVTDA
jgi:hypothetical protein